MLGLALAAWNYWRVAAMLKPLIHSVEVANAIAFLVIASAGDGGGGDCWDRCWQRFFRRSAWDAWIRLAGAVFGFVEGMVLVTSCILVTVAFFPETEWLTEARLPRYFFGALHVSTHVTPSRLADRVRKELQTLEEESPQWMHPRRRANEFFAG